MHYTNPLTQCVKHNFAVRLAMLLILWYFLSLHRFGTVEKSLVFG